MVLGQKIKKIRELKNLTQEHMAIQLGLTQGTYSRMELGEVDIPYTRLEEISKILEMKPEEIIAFDERMVFNVMYNTPGKDLVVYQVQQHEDTIKSLKEEIVYLKSVLDKILLSDKKGNKE
jgi:transcriptional regulator with XRE-family HTH domain